MAGLESLLCERLPPDWDYGVMPDGRVFFIDEKSRTTTWVHPMGEPVQDGLDMPDDLPPCWSQSVTSEGIPYYVDHVSRQSTFMHPITLEASAIEIPPESKPDGKQPASFNPPHTSAQSHRTDAEEQPPELPQKQSFNQSYQDSLEGSHDSRRPKEREISDGGRPHIGDQPQGDRPYRDNLRPHGHSDAIGPDRGYDQQGQPRHGEPHRMQVDPRLGHPHQQQSEPRLARPHHQQDDPRTVQPQWSQGEPRLDHPHRLQGEVPRPDGMRPHSDMSRPDNRQMYPQHNDSFEHDNRQQHRQPEPPHMGGMRQPPPKNYMNVKAPPSPNSYDSNVSANRLPDNRQYYNGPQRPQHLNMNDGGFSEHRPTPQQHGEHRPSQHHNGPQRPQHLDVNDGGFGDPSMHCRPSPGQPPVPGYGLSPGNTGSPPGPVLGRRAEAQNMSATSPTSPTSPTTPTGKTPTNSKSRKPGRFRKNSTGKNKVLDRTPSAKRSQRSIVSMRGWLHKQDSTALKQWKKRWFVLSDFCLFYYKGPDEVQTMGSILLPSYKINPCLSEDNITKKFAFKAEHANMRTYIFAAATQEDMKRWMNSMSLASILQRDPNMEKEFNRTDGDGMPAPAPHGSKDGDAGFNIHRPARHTLSPPSPVNRRSPLTPPGEPHLRNRPMSEHYPRPVSDRSRPLSEHYPNYADPIHRGQGHDPNQSPPAYSPDNRRRDFPVNSMPYRQSANNASYDSNNSSQPRRQLDMQNAGAPTRYPDGKVQHPEPQTPQKLDARHDPHNPTHPTHQESMKELQEWRDRQEREPHPHDRNNQHPIYENVSSDKSQSFEASPPPSRPPLPASFMDRMAEDIAQQRTPNTAQNILESSQRSLARVNEPHFFQYPDVSPPKDQTDGGVRRHDSGRVPHPQRYQAYIDPWQKARQSPLRSPDYPMMPWAEYTRRDNYMNVPYQDDYEQLDSLEHEAIRQLHDQNGRAQQRSYLLNGRVPQVSYPQNRRVQTFSPHQIRQINQQYYPMNGQRFETSVPKNTNSTRMVYGTMGQNEPKSILKNRSKSQHLFVKPVNLFYQRQHKSDSYLQPTLPKSAPVTTVPSPMSNQPRMSVRSSYGMPIYAFPQKMSSHVRPSRPNYLGNRQDHGRPLFSGGTGTNSHPIQTVKEDPTMPESQVMATAPHFSDPNNSRYINGHRMSITAEDLLGKSHEELVLLLIELRRKQSSMESSRNKFISQLDILRQQEELFHHQQPTPDVAAQHSRQVYNIRQDLDEVKRHLEVHKPMVNLVDNMVKMGSLYGGQNAMLASQYKKHFLKPEEYTPPKKMIEFSRQHQEAALTKKMKEDVKQLTNEETSLEEKQRQLIELDKELQHISHSVRSLQQSKEMLEKELSNVKRQLDQHEHGDPRHLDSLYQQYKAIENELHRVNKMLAHDSQKLEEVAAENAKVEHEVMVLRSKVMSPLQRSSSTPALSSEKLRAKMRLEKEVDSVRNVMEGLSRQGQQLSTAMNTLRSSTQQLNEADSPNTYNETDLDSMQTTNIAVIEPVNGDISQESPLDISEADDNMKRFYGLIPKEKPKAQTVRDVKQKNERKRQTKKPDDDSFDTVDEPVRGHAVNTLPKPKVIKHKESQLSAAERLLGRRPSSDLVYGPRPFSLNKTSISTPVLTKAVQGEPPLTKTPVAKRNARGRYMTISSSHPAVLETPKVLKNVTNELKRSKDDQDVPIRSKTTDDVIDSNIDEWTIDRELLGPEKVLIPERYQSESEEEELTEEEKLQREEKAEKIRKMLSAHSLQEFTYQELNVPESQIHEKVSEEKKRREMVLELRHNLAREVTLKSKDMAAKRRARTRSETSLNSPTSPLAVQT